MNRHILRNLLVTAAIASGSAACGGDAANSNSTAATNTAANAAAPEPRKNKRIGEPIDIKLKDKAIELDPQSSLFFSEDLTINTPGGKTVNTVMLEVVIANYKLDASDGKSTAMARLTSPDQMRLVLQFTQGPDAKKERAAAASEYRLRSNEPYSLLGVVLYTSANGEEVKTSISPDAAGAKGSVKISSTSTDSVGGEIDVSNAELAIFGSFLAMAGKPAAK